MSKKSKIRWENVKNKNERKSYIKEIYACCFKKIINAEKFNNFMNSRKSSLMFVENKLLLVSHKNGLNSSSIFITANKELRIGQYKLRFKSAGSQVSSTWKINVEMVSQ